MAARAIGSVTVSFGLVSIPVKLYTATNASERISFNLLHAKCKTRVKQQYICPKDGETVPRDQMVKGYEFAKDQYVTFTDEELKQLEEKATYTIEIVEFVPMTKIDPVFYDKAYYLGPDKGGAKAYSLLAETMQRAGRVALGRYAARGKQYLVLLRPHDGALVMHQLMYAEEVRSLKDVPLDRVEVREQELKLAMQLVDQISGEGFHPEKYEDDVRTRILGVIEQKVAGQEVTLAPEEQPGAQIIDLMEALKASLTGTKGAAAASSTEKAAEESERKPAKRAPRKGGEDAKAAKK
jgi:DNA end-binding protein Ku